MQRALDRVNKTTGLKWFDFLIFKYLKFYSGESVYSLNFMDVATFVKGLEYMDISNYIESSHYKALEEDQKKIK